MYRAADHSGLIEFGELILPKSQLPQELPGPSAGGHIHHSHRIGAGQTGAITAAQFLNQEGVGFQEFAVRPKISGSDWAITPITYLLATIGLGKLLYYSSLPDKCKGCIFKWPMFFS